MSPTRQVHIVSRTLLSVLWIYGCKPEVEHPTQEPTVPLEVTVVEEAPAVSDVAPAEPVLFPFSIRAPSTEVWIVLDGECRDLEFRPRSPEEGFVWVAGLHVNYDVTEEGLEFFNLQTRKNGVLAARDCRTLVKLGEDGRLGEADLFPDKQTCEADRAHAIPFDDSDEFILTKCEGATLAVDIPEIRCMSRPGWYQIPAGTLGCFSAVIAHLRAEAVK